MMIVRLCGLIVFLIIAISAAVDIRHSLTSSDPHPLITGTHAAMLLIALFAVSITNERLSNQLLRALAILRGIKPKTDEHPTHRPRRRKPSRGDP